MRTDAELFALWRRLMGPGGFDTRTLWLLFLDAAGRPEQVIVPIEDLPPRADARLVHALAQIFADLVDSGDVDSIALLVSRAGARQMSAEDRAWARAVRPLSPKWPVHLATAGRIQTFAPDDLIPVDAA